MFWRIIHDFLKWFPVAFGGGSVAIAAVWSSAKDWIAGEASWAWAKMSDPWIAFVVVLALAAYAAAIIWSGRKAGEDGAGGDTHIHHHYGTLQERLAEAVEPRSTPIQPDNAVHAHTTGSLVATEEGDTCNITGVLGLSGLYIGYVFAAAGHLKAKHYLEFAIVGYNGAEVAIQITEVAGRIRAGTGDLRDYVKLPTPLFQGVLNAEPGKEFVFQMRQDVSVEQADEYLAALEDSKSVGLDLRELDIIVSSVANPQKRARLPLWDGVNLQRRDDIVSNRNTIISLTGVEAKVSLGTLTTRVDEATEGHNA